MIPAFEMELAAWAEQKTCVKLTAEQLSPRTCVRLTNIVMIVSRLVASLL